MTFRKSIFIIVLINTILFYKTKGQSAENNYSNVIDCWEKAYKETISLKNELLEFEHQLLDKKILKDNTYKSYKTLFSEMNNKGKKNTNWLNVNVYQYLPAEPFKYCMKKHKPPKDDIMIRKWVYLFSIYHILSKDFATISIIAYNPDSIVINNINANLDTFKRVFKVELDVIYEQEIPKDEININVNLKNKNSDPIFLKRLKEKINDYKLNTVNYLSNQL